MRMAAPESGRMMSLLGLRGTAFLYSCGVISHILLEWNGDLILEWKYGMGTTDIVSGVLHPVLLP